MKKSTINTVRKSNSQCYCYLVVCIFWSTQILKTGVRNALLITHERGNLILLAAECGSWGCIRG